jgi:fumarate reductase subunit C
MKSEKPSPTRTAPPQMPDQFPSGGRYRAYTLFDATGFVYLLLGLIAVRVVWALGNGPVAWQSMLDQLSNPLYIAFHALGLVSVLFVGVRFFRLFPKAQPPRIGPLKPPPGPVISVGLYGAWIGVTVLLSAILAGGIF